MAHVTYGGWVGNKETYKCSECSGYVEFWAKRCPHCQTWLGGGEDPRQKRNLSESRVSGSNNSCAVIGVLCVFGCIFAISPGFLIAGVYAFFFPIEEPTFFISSIIISIVIYVIFNLLFPNKAFIISIAVAILSFIGVVYITNQEILRESKSPFLRIEKHKINDNSSSNEKEVENSTVSFPVNNLPLKEEIEDIDEESTVEEDKMEEDKMEEDAEENNQNNMTEFNDEIVE